MTTNKDFILKQARYDLMQLLEILFNKKDISRINSKVTYSFLIAQTKDFVDIVLCNKNHIISSICKSDTLDDYTIGHSINVCMISILIGNLMGFSDDKMLELALSSLLHDIGKRLTPKELIFKDGRLTETEFDILKKHPSNGADLISSIYPETSEHIIRGISEHHERMDGNGYPFGLSWYDISEYGRIIAIADVYEAFTALRSYHEKRTIAEGVQCIESSKGLDRNIVELFTENTVFYPAGMYVVLSDQSVAVVSNNQVGEEPDIVAPGTNNFIDIHSNKIVALL